VIEPALATLLPYAPRDPRCNLGPFRHSCINAEHDRFVFLFLPGAFHQPWSQHLLPAVQALNNTSFVIQKFLRYPFPVLGTDCCHRCSQLLVLFFCPLPPSVMRCGRSVNIFLLFALLFWLLDRRWEDSHLSCQRCVIIEASKKGGLHLRQLYLGRGEPLVAEGGRGRQAAVDLFGEHAVHSSQCGSCARGRFHSRGWRLLPLAGAVFLHKQRLPIGGHAFQSAPVSFCSCRLDVKRALECEVAPWQPEGCKVAACTRGFLSVTFYGSTIKSRLDGGFMRRRRRNYPPAMAGAVRPGRSCACALCLLRCWLCDGLHWLSSVFLKLEIGQVM
jgi:hypothetical protein